MVHTCTICNKSFANICWLRRHEQRKTPCAPIVEPRADTLGDPDKIKCKFCNREYASYNSMHRHIRDTCNIAPNKKNGNAGMELLYEHTLQKQNDARVVQQRLDALEAQNAEMINLMRQLAVNGAPTALVPATNTTAGAIGPVTNITGPVSNTTLAAGEVGLIQCDYANIATDKSVAFNLFGKESLAHANSDRIRAILDDSLRDTSSIQAAARMAVTKTAMLIYSDPDHPENLTCYMPNKKTNDVLTHTERGWEIYPVSMVINQIGQKTIDHLFAKQPFENADHYTLIMKELQQNEKAYITDSLIRPILIRNRSLLEQATDEMPKCGMP